MNKVEIGAYPLDQLQNISIQLGEPKFRGKQLFEWIHIQKCKKFADMNNLPQNFRQKLEEKYKLTTVQEKKKWISKIDGTTKYLYELSDGEAVETVLMSYQHGNSLCISTQVGCKMGCTFCASTKAGFVRNLSASEMLAQIDESEKNSGKSIHNLVLMGIGEPLDNWEEFISFLSIYSNPLGRRHSLRNVTVSTCGVVPRIYDLADQELQLTLAISLHAPNDELRKKTMPIANQYSIEELLKACRYYTQKTGRRITFEYALIEGENDSLQQADELAARLKGLLCHVNLIPVNPIKEKSYRSSTKEQARIFQNRLESKKITATIRRTLGEDIAAACGQLRRENAN